MPDKKLTDSEIVKALECAIRNDCDCNCVFLLPNKVQDVLDLINHLQARIDHNSHNMKHLVKSVRDYQKALEQAKAENERLKTNNNWLKGLLNYDFAVIRTRSGKGEKLKQIIHYRVKEIKVEAYKEFAERLKNEIDIRPTHSKKQNEYVFFLIDNLLKELVGDGGCDTCQSLACDDCELYEEAVGEDK